MIQKRDVTPNTPALLGQRCLLAGLSLVSGASLLSGGVALAQESSSTEAIPSAAELLGTPPAAPEPAPVVQSEPAAPTRPAGSSEPERVSPERSAPAAQAAPATPSPASEASSRAASEPIVIPESIVERSPTPASATFDYSELYIDTTDYQVGATRGDRPNILFSDRSTGCNAVLAAGQQVPSSLCASGGGKGSVVNTAAGGGSITIGPVRVSARGIGLNPATVQDFYNRTMRPLAFAGNGNTRLMYPLSIPSAITSLFGWRIHPITGDRRFHYGTDIGAPTGTPVLAAYSGRVDTASYLGGYGLTVVLTHNDGNAQTLYAHLSELFVRPGEWVEQGEVVGRVGSTGNSTGPHLHFEYRERTAEGWVAFDPTQALQGALSNFVQAFRIAEAPKAENEAIAFEVKGLQDFGKLASDVQPDQQKVAQDK